MQDNVSIGITFVSENYSNSIDSFWIMIKPEILMNPFDFISVENIQNTKTIGMVKELKRIFLDRQIFSKKQYPFQYDILFNIQEKLSDGITVAKIDVIANRQLISIEEDISSKTSNHDKIPSKSKNWNINMPVQEGKLVTFPPFH